MSSEWLPKDTYQANHEFAFSKLGEELNNGTIAIFLGAGVSKGMGLLNWWELVKKCRETVGLSVADIDRNTSNEQLRRFADELQRGRSNDDYKEIIRNTLYANAHDNSHLLEQKLLAVLGALLMKSRRGSVQDVITLNFDDVLERYLQLHGFVAKTIIELPCLLPFSDVNIYHPHGFLPSGGSITNSSEKIIFGQYSYDELFAERGPWWELVIRLLESKINIFVGLSIDDPTLGALLVKAKNNISSIGDIRPIGFWLLGPDDKSESENFLLDRNIVPIRLRDYETSYTRFLLNVCQKARMLY